MSQSDMNIASQLMAAARTDLNLILLALASNSSGASAPASPVTDQLWLDTTTTTGNVLKFWDGVDWIPLLIIDRTGNTARPATNAVLEAGTSNASSVNAQTAAVAPPLTAYATGQFFVVKSGGSNAGSMTMDFGPGAKTVKKRDGSTLKADEFRSGLPFTMRYDGTDLILLDPETLADSPMRYVDMIDDFEGDSLDAKWGSAIGSDGAVVAPAIDAGQVNGRFKMTTGAGAGATMAVNGVQLHRFLQWRASQGTLVFEARVFINTITNVAVFFGFTDQISALEMPIYSAASGDTITTDATDAVGVMFDTAMNTDNWWLVGVANNVDATPQNAGVAPTAATFETWRIEITAAGVATFYRNDVAIGSAMTGAVTPGAVLTPVVAAFTRTAASVVLGVDFIRCRKPRV